MVSYRSPEEFQARFDGPGVIADGEPRFPVDAYLSARGEEFSRRFSAAAYCSLSRAIDLHRVDATEISTPTLVIGSRSDQLVPLAQLEELAAQIAGPSRCVVLDSHFGHDAFLKETDALAPLLRKALEGRRS